MSNETKKTIRVRWVCGEKSCKQVNVRVISKYHVIFEDICEHCDKYIHEPVTRIIKEK